MVGIQHLIAPRVWTDLAGIDIALTVTWRVIGAAVVGFGVGSWLAAREDDYGRVRIVVQMQVVWSVLGAAAIGWGIMAESVPPLEWVNAAVLAGFAVAFGAWHLRLRGA